MTTPKKPNYMFPDLQGLPEEFRRLAAEAAAQSEAPGVHYEDRAHLGGKIRAFNQAAQMLEERLNG